MKRMVSIGFLVMLISAILPVCSAQQDNHGEQTNRTQAKSAKKTIHLSGRVAMDGKTVVSDRDSRIWKVANREILSGSEGRLVRIKAYRETDASEIRVTVLRLREERTTAKLDDAAFRR